MILLFRLRDLVAKQAAESLPQSLNRAMRLALAE